MRSKNDRIIAFLMVLPSLILLGIFVYYFIGRAIETSLTDWGENPDQPALSETVVKSYIGLRNYENLMTDVVQSNFRLSLVNTFFLTVFFVAGSIVGGLFLAVLLDRNPRGENLFRTIFLFPMALSFVVTGTIWRWMLQPSGGINLLPTFIGLPAWDFGWLSSSAVWLPFEWQNIPLILNSIGIAVLAFLAVRIIVNYRKPIILDEKPKGVRRPLVSSPDVRLFMVIALVLLVLMAGLWNLIWPPLDVPTAENAISPKGFNSALLGIILAAIWQMSGYTMAMFLAGIRGIPDELREAARVDGASEFGVYYYIILPQLNPIILSAMIILGHISLKIFDLVFAMAGPDNAKTVVPGLLVYTKGFRSNQFAQASAVAVIMLALVALIIVPYLWSQLREEKK
jgi:glucose/mannose transport system permease protein